MPRRRRTQSGAPAQQIESVQGQRYGEGVAQQEMQRLLPAPQTRGEPIVASPVESASPAPTSPAAPPPDLAALLGQAPAGLLGGTQRPLEPVTTGMPSGPGAGPAVLGSLNPTTPLARMLRTLSQRTGDPGFRDMADRAGL